MKTTQEMIDVMAAHIAGKKIEFSLHGTKRWELSSNPCWDWNTYDYRIARKPRTLWVNEYVGGFGAYCHSKEEADRCDRGRIRCVKFVEVLEDEQ